MMSTTAMRMRILSALGLPLTAAIGNACATPATPAAEPATTIVEVGNGNPEPVVQPSDTSSDDIPLTNDTPWRSCGADRTLDWFCGAPAKTNAGGSCPKQASEVTRGFYLGLESPSAKRDYDHALSKSFSETSQHERCCYSKCSDLTKRVKTGNSGRGYGRKQICITPLKLATQTHEPKRNDCPLVLTTTNGSGAYDDSASQVEGTKLMAQTGARTLKPCCYQVPPRRQIMLGRALRNGEQQLLAPSQRGQHWLKPYPMPQLDGLSAALRQHLGRRWLADAALEHASVGAFAQLSLQLLALGAPAQLVEESHRAALDEVHHARASYALASHYLGTPFGPGRLAAPTPSAVDKLRLLKETFEDGCIGETVAALVAQRSAAAVSTNADPAADNNAKRGIVEVLQTIADDELRHAALAWRIVAWAARDSAPARQALREALAQLEQTPEPDAAALCHDASSGHGVLSETARNHVAQEAIAAIVLPCGHALLKQLDEPKHPARRHAAANPRA